MNTSSTSHAWANLIQHHEKYGDLSLSERFNTNYGRAEQLSFSCGDLWIDVSKQLLEVETTELLFELAEEREVSRFFDDMFKGRVVNFSEKQRALHIYLRDPKIYKSNEMFGDVSEEAHENLERMKELAEKLENGLLVGATGKQIRSVVNLGIGGSHLGPFMAFEALKRYVNPELEVRWSSGLHEEELEDALKGLDPEETIIIICSKTFKTAETLRAAEDCKEWLKEGIEQAKWDIGMETPLREEYSNDDEWSEQLEPNPTLSSHMFAATSIPKNALAFGIGQVNIFRFSETIGGRFSLASPVSLGLILSIGYENFRSMLDGMHLIDEHVRENQRNVPLLLGLIDVWNRSILGLNSLAVVPYSYRLRKLVPYIQQLMMESLGKSVSRKGERLGLETGGAVWGASGTDAQHSFFQLLHQGTESIPIDLIGFALPGPFETEVENLEFVEDHQLIANLIAQAKVLAFGNSLEEHFDPHLEFKIVPGNKPSTVILAPELSPSILGQLVALYEHRTIAVGAIWGINPFDQWGVELGKKAALQITDELRPENWDLHGLGRWEGLDHTVIAEYGGVGLDHDSSTNSLMTRYMGWFYSLKTRYRNGPI